MCHMLVTLDVCSAAPIAAVLRLERNRRLARMKGQSTTYGGFSHTHPDLFHIELLLCNIVIK
jgi:hypothetical protein